MRVSDDVVLDGVLFIGVVNKTTRQFLPIGTGFLVVINYEGFIFQSIVTARHVIEMIEGNEVYLRGNLKSGGTEIFYTEKSDWRFHPNPPKGHYVDVAAVASAVPPEKFNIKHLDISDDTITDAAIKEQNIGVGDDVFMVGLFTNHYGESKNIPVVRCGTISAMPQEPMKTEFGFVDGYLIEARSLGGLSGSPVFIQSSFIMANPDGTLKLRVGKSWYFLGLLCGHWLVQNPEDSVAVPEGSRETANITTGIGIVVPAKQIIETINHPDFVERRAIIVKQQKEAAKGKFKFDSAPQPQEQTSVEGDKILRVMLNTPPAPVTKSKANPDKGGG